jgi:hypothetical protein
MTQAHRPARLAREARRKPEQPGEDLEHAVDYIVDDCFFTIGQVVGTRKTLDYAAVIWLRDHYRARFLAAMRAFGNRWLDDRDNVTGVAFLLAERATRHAGDASSIDLEAARRAAADVERYCTLHSGRRARTMGLDTRGTDRPLLAGYWCTQDPPPLTTNLD